MYDKSAYKRDLIGLMGSGYTFYSSILFELDVQISFEIETACVSATTLTVNPIFFAALTKKERHFVLIHEVMHFALLHIARKGSRNHSRYNRACDYIVNSILSTDSRLKMPVGGLLDAQYQGLTAEKIYDLLPAENDSGGAESGKNPCGEMDCTKAAEAKAAEGKAKRIIQGALTQAKVAGDKSIKGLRGIIDTAHKPQIPWQVVLQDAVTQIVRSDYNWSYRNLCYSNLYLPSQHAESKKIAIVLDQSGSVDDKILSEFISEISYLLNSQNLEGVVFAFDTKCEKVCDFEDFKPQTFKRTLQGGTDLTCFCEYMGTYDDEFSLFVIMTDGEFGTGYANRLPVAPCVMLSTGSNAYNNCHRDFMEVIAI